MPKLTLSFKGQTLFVHHLEEGETFIGRDPQCGIVIDSLAVMERHAKVLFEKGQCRVLCLDQTHPIRLNDKATEDEALEHGDEISVGKHTLTFASDGISLTTPGNADDEVPQSLPEVHRDEDPASSETASTAYIQILSGEHIGRIIPLNRNMVRLGKSGGDCAMIVFRDGGHYLSALEGSMPSIDGVMIGDESILLRNGNTIQIGHTELQFYH
jgi:pSer/pThr/pTyr-binding forkhead associated (FHA) protein